MEGVIISDELTCSFCGANIKLGDVFCNNCGISLEQDENIRTEFHQSNIDYLEEKITYDQNLQNTNYSSIESQQVQQPIMKSYSQRLNKEKTASYFTRLSFGLSVVTCIIAWFTSSYFLLIFFAIISIISGVIGLTSKRWKTIAIISLVITSFAIIIFIINVATNGVLTDLF